MMGDEERIKRQAQCEALIGLAKMLVPMAKGKDQIRLKITLKCNDLSEKIFEFAENHADSKNFDKFSEKQLNDALNYLGLVELGLQQFVEGEKKGENKDA